MKQDDDESNGGAPPPAAKPTHAERDRFVSETRYDCRVSDVYDGTALLVERLYDGRTSIWYGALQVVCSYEEAHDFDPSADLQIQLEDGRIGTARAVWGEASAVTVDGVAWGCEAGDCCLLHVVGIRPLAKPIDLSPLL